MNKSYSVPGIVVRSEGGYNGTILAKEGLFYFNRPHTRSKTFPETGDWVRFEINFCRKFFANNVIAMTPNSFEKNLMREVQENHSNDPFDFKYKSRLRLINALLAQEPSQSIRLYLLFEKARTLFSLNRFSESYEIFGFLENKTIGPLKRLVLGELERHYMSSFEL